jgi:hypothetical protein
MKKLIFFSILILFTACSPAKRLNRLLRENPELVKSDTIRINDTIALPGIKADTVVLFSQLKDIDTIRIEKEKLKIQLIRKYDTLYLTGEKQPDTVFYTREIEVPKIQIVEEKNKISWFLIGLASGAIGILIISLAFFIKEIRNS